MITRMKRRGRRGVAALCLLAGLSAAVVVSIGGATASAAPDPEAVSCGGKLSFPKPRHPSALLDVSWTCNKDIQSFTLISNKLVDYFKPDWIVIGDDGLPSNIESFDCEGPIPGWGIGCKGTSSAKGSLASHQVQGQIALAVNPCVRKQRRQPLRAWLAVAYARLNPANLSVYQASSEPFRIKRPKCPPLPRRRHR